MYDDETMFCRIELVKYYIRTGDLAKGDEQYNKLVTEFAENQWLASSICFIGDTYLRAGEIDLASLLYNKVAATWPDDPQTIYAKAGLAKVAFYLDLDEDGYKTIDEIFIDYADNPDIADAVYGVGDLCRSIGIYERRREVSAVNPDNSSHIPVHTGQKVKDYYAKALGVWERLIEELPDSDVTAQAYHFAAECCGVLGEPQKEIEYFQRAADNWPNYKNAYHCQFMVGRLCEILKRNGRMPALEADPIINQAYRKVAQNYPDCAWAKYATKWLDSYNAREKGDLK